MGLDCSIGEINIVCSDIERSLNFYTGVLGFSVVSHEGDCVHLACGGQAVLLLPAAAPANETVPYCSVPVVSLDLVVRDIEAAYRHCKVHDTTFERPWTADSRSFHIRDPDGLVWEVIGPFDV